MNNKVLIACVVGVVLGVSIHLVVKYSKTYGRRHGKHEQVMASISALHGECLSSFLESYRFGKTENGMMLIHENDVDKFHTDFTVFISSDEGVCTTPHFTGNKSLGKGTTDVSSGGVLDFVKVADTRGSLNVYCASLDSFSYLVFAKSDVSFNEKIKRLEDWQGIGHCLL